MSKRCEVSVADRREAVLCLLRREEPAVVIARRVGVNEPTLYRWRDEFLAAEAGWIVAVVTVSKRWFVESFTRYRVAGTFMQPGLAADSKHQPAAANISSPSVAGSGTVVFMLAPEPLAAGSPKWAFPHGVIVLREGRAHDFFARRYSLRRILRTAQLMRLRDPNKTLDIAS